MPKNFKPPSLAEITYEYLGLHKRRARLKDYEDMEQRFQKVLIRTETVEEVRAALAVDRGRKLPVQLKSPLYERLLSLQGRSVGLLREYAQIMYEFGPEFHAYADKLWREANEMEAAEEQA